MRDLEYREGDPYLKDLERKPLSELIGLAQLAKRNSIQRSTGRVDRVGMDIKFSELVANWSYQNGLLKARGKPYHKPQDIANAVIRVKNSK